MVFVRQNFKSSMCDAHKKVKKIIYGQSDNNLIIMIIKSIVIMIIMIMRMVVVSEAMKIWIRIRIDMKMI